MEYFYKELKAGKTKDVALQQAKLSYLKATGDAEKYPHFWAAFVPIGDMQAMQIGGGIQWWMWFLISLVILILVFIWKKSQ